MKIYLFVFSIALFFCYKVEGQQNLIVSKSQIDKLHQDGYIIANDYKNLLSDQLNHDISIFELLAYTLLPWKGHTPSFSEEDNKVKQLDQFFNGGLEEIKKVNLIQKDLYQTLRKDSAYTKITHYTKFYNPVIMALWKDFFSKRENLVQTIDMLVRQNWIEKKKGEQLKALPKLAYQDIIVSVKHFEPINFPNTNIPLEAGLQTIRDILLIIDPHLSLTDHHCQIDTSELSSLDYFKRGKKYFDNYDSTEIKLGESCTLFFALDSFRTECDFFKSWEEDTPDSINIYSIIGSERFTLAVNQLLIDAENENRFSIFNLGNVGPSGYHTYNLDGLFDLFPQFRLLPEFLPSIYKGNPRQSVALHEEERKLIVIPNTKDSDNSLNFNIRNTIRTSNLMPYKKKLAITQWLSDYDLIDTIYQKKDIIINEIKRGYYNDNFDILSNYYLKIHRASMTETILWAENFTDKKSPVFGIFNYFKKITDKKFNPENIKQKEVEKNKIEISFTINGNPHQFIVNLSLPGSKPYLSILSSCFSIAQKENLLLDRSLYYVPFQFVPSSMNDLMFVLPLNGEERIKKMFPFGVIKVSGTSK